MFTHLPACLKGPVTQDRGWWPRTDEESMDHEESTPLDRTGRNAVPRLDDPDIRQDLVERVRQEIADGTYDTPEKWEAALDRLLDRLERE